MTMIETLGVMLYCCGFLLCCLAYRLLVDTSDSCSVYRKDLEHKLSYLSSEEIDKRVDMYLKTLVYNVFMFGTGCLLVFFSILFEPGLFYYPGLTLGAIYIIAFVYGEGRDLMEGGFL